MFTNRHLKFLARGCIILLFIVPVTHTSFPREQNGKYKYKHIYISIDSSSSSKSTANRNRAKILSEPDCLPVWCFSYTDPMEWSEYRSNAFAKFFTLITVFAITMGTKASPYDSNLENACPGLTWWQWASWMITVSLFRVEDWSILFKSYTSGCWITCCLSSILVRHISPGEICHSSAII